MTFSKSLSILGLDRTTDRQTALRACKSALIQARRAGDDERAKVLSQCKQSIKRHFGSHCVDCGVRIATGYLRCIMHHHWFRHYRRALPVGMAILFCLATLAAPSPRTGTALVSWNYTFGDTNSPANASVTNFVVSFGTLSGSYTGAVNAGTNFAVQVPNLTRGATYFFAVSAQSTNGLESDYSVETSLFVPNRPGKPTSPNSALQ